MTTVQGLAEAGGRGRKRTRVAVSPGGALVAVGAAGLALTVLSGWNQAVWIAAGGLWHIGLLAYSLWASFRARGARRTLEFFAWVAGISLVAEFLGSRYGLIFGAYRYDPAVGRLMLFGQVPAVIPFEWWTVVFLATGVTDAIAGPVPAGGAARRRWLIRAAALDALAATALDLSLDPGVVRYFRLWTWTDPAAPGVQGIPLSNYAGWLLTVGVMSLVVRSRLWAGVRPERGPVQPLLYLLFAAKMASLGLLVREPAIGLPGLLAALVIAAWAGQAALRREAENAGG